MEEDKKIEEVKQNDSSKKRIFSDMFSLFTGRITPTVSSSTTVVKDTTKPEEKRSIFSRFFSRPSSSPSSSLSTSSEPVLSSSDFFNNQLYSVAEGLPEYTRGNFTIELMISAHGSLDTKIPDKYSSEEIEIFESDINICMFAFAPIGYSCNLWPSQDLHYKKELIRILEKYKRPQIHDKIFGKMIVKSEEVFGKYSELEDVEIKKLKQHRSHTMLCDKKQYNKSYDFFESFDKNKETDKIEFGVFILKTLTFNNGVTISANTNLLDFPLFKDFMNERYKKNIRSISEKNKVRYGYSVILEDGNDDGEIKLSEIVSFFEMLDENKEISGLNIFDLACNTIFDERSARRLSRREHHSPDSKIEQFGGKKDKKINLKYLPKSITKKNKRKRVNKLLKSRKLYKKGKYYTRKNVKSSRV